jgi:hypothetical protein
MAIYRALSTEEINNRIRICNSSVEAIETEISLAITIPLSKTRSRISANVEPWVEVAIVRLALVRVLLGCIGVVFTLS